MAPQRLGIMFLFLWVQRAANEPIVTGIIGSTAELRCQYTGEEPFILNQFRIQWQKKGEDTCFVDAYFPNEDMKEHQCEEFRNRTQVEEQLKEGDFTLKLLNVSPKDELTYKCVVQRKKSGRYEVIHYAHITLKVAANYSKPNLTGPVKSGEEMTFFCHSSHGYPRQKLYWINQMDSSLLNATENVTEEPDGTFSINSTLTMEASTNIKLGCTIENERLYQNITTTFELNTSTSSPRIHPIQHNTIIVLGAFAVVAAVLLFILCNWWVKRKPSRQSAYVDVCQNAEAAHTNAAV